MHNKPSKPRPQSTRPQTTRIIDQQDPAGIALIAALLCFVLAIFQGVTAFQTGIIPAELYLLVALTLVFLATWRFARKM